MKKTISDPVFIKNFRDKISAWVSGQLKVKASVLPRIDIAEITEYPLYRIVMKAEIQSRKIEKFERFGAAVPKSAGAPSPTPEIDPWSLEVPQEESKDGTRVAEIQSSLESALCKKCAGAGHFTCPECQGQKNVYCTACRGDGKLDCPVCRKTLKAHCQPCAGIGKVYSDAKQAYEDCPRCGGKGSTPCKDCANGYIPCSTCGGSGRLPCVKCGETGNLECAVCSGKGNIVTGAAVQISSSLSEEKLELPNPDIPARILNEEFPAVSFAADTDSQPLEKPAEEFSTQLENLEKKLNIPPGARVTKKTIFREKKYYYQVRSSISGVENASWFLSAGEKLIGGKGFLDTVNSALLSDVKGKLKAGGAAEVRNAVKEIENIPALKAEAANIMKNLSKGTLAPFMYGGLAGAVISMAGVFLFEYSFVRSSLHFREMSALSMAAVILLSAACAAAVSLVKPAFANTNKKRAVTAAFMPVILCLASLCAGALLRVNPAQQLDANQMRQEYSANFPFGLRTIASAEDIEFLKKLIEKYSASGIDLGSVRKDLAWLEAKKLSDDATMKKIEASARNIENASEIDKAKNMRVRSRGRARISFH